MNLEKSKLTTENNPRVIALFRNFKKRIYRRTDRMFAYLMPIQFVLAIILSIIDFSFNYRADQNYLWMAIIFGGLITIPPTILALKFSGKLFTRYTIAVCQILMSSLLIYLTEGRIVTHFHIFGSLALLSFYRDWRVLVSATLITLIDHIFRGWYYPQTIYGISNGAEWLWVEHFAWIGFEIFFLIIACKNRMEELWNSALKIAELDDSEARFRAVVEQTTEGIFLLSQENLNVIDCNQAFANLIGYENADEVKKLNAFDFDIAKPEEIELMTKIVKDENRSLSTERKYRKKDGSSIYVEIIGRCISYKENIAYCVNVRDITERKNAEIEMKRLALVAQKTQNAVVITNPKGEIEWVNHGFTRLTGYEFEEVKGKKPGRVLQGESTNAETVLEMRKAMKEQKPFEGELYNYRKDGKGYWISISFMPIHDKRGIHRGFIAIEMDITEHKKLEQDLRYARNEMEQRVAERTAELGQAQQFLRKVIDNVPNMIFVKDKDGRYTLANQALTQLYGVKMKDLIGKTDADLISNKKEAESFFNDDRHVIEEMEEKVVFEQKFTDREGNVHWLQTVKRPLLGDSGVEHILGIATDLTERKILESQLRHAQKLESIGQLAAGIAHEINTPTQYVGDNTRFIRDSFNDINQVLEKYNNLLKEAQNGGVKAETIKEIEEEIKSADLEYLVEEVPNAINQTLDGVSRIAKIVQSMKDFAHPGTKDKQSIDLNKAIESTITVAKNEWKYVADMETEFDLNLPPVPCLLGEFNQVVLNMVINASHAIKDVVGDGTHGKGKITISTTKADNKWAEIRIADTGTGIPKSIQTKVFDPFFTTKEVGKGTGQGLAISHSVIVEKHHGKLTFESEEGKGTTFIIKLPLNEITTSA